MSNEDPIHITIDRLNKKGWGVGTYSPSSQSVDTKMEVVGGVPGDVLKVTRRTKRRGKWRGDLQEVVHPSAIRVIPRCAHVPLCGGCVWQQMDYTAQLQEKQRRIQEAFTSILSKAPTALQPIISCQDPWYYRNKMEFSFSQNRAGERFLGLVIAGSKGHVFNLLECSLVSLWFSNLLGRVRTWWEQSGLAAYRLNDTGSLRTLIIREGKKTNEKLVMLTVSGNPAFALHSPQLKSFIETVKASVPESEWPTLSIFLRIQQLQKGAPTQFYEMHLFGPTHFHEKLTLELNPPLELTFKISPTSFFQPNTLQAERLYSEALKHISFPKRHVLDLYAGTATLGMAIATRAETVTAIELNPHACFDAEANKELNQISNLEIVWGDVGKKLDELKQRADFIPPDLIVVDPPRTGLDQTALTHILQLQSPEILYVSCNPITQAMNIQELIAHGYQLTLLQPLDQFPHTLHVETIAILKKI